MNLVQRGIESIKIRVREFPLVEIGNRPSSQNSPNSLIPAVCYQTWTNKKFGKTHARELMKFRELNNDISFLLLDDSEVNEYMRSRWGKHQIYGIYTSSLFGPMKADIFRYCIIFDCGGYYFDISKSITVPISSLHSKDAAGFVSYEANSEMILPDMDAIKGIDNPHNAIIQWGFGFEKSHPFLKLLIENICNYYEVFKDVVFENPKSGILALTGPGMFTKTFREAVALEHMENVKQLGIDFNGFGISSLPGSHVRQLTTPHYTQYKNSIIVK
jgi:mannosyltransferase OCH1-like enzyme